MERSWTLPNDPTSPAVARSVVAAACDGLSRDLVEITLLLTSELVTNVVQHGTGTIGLALHDDDSAIEVEVCDESPSIPRQADRGDDAVTGRGLLLVESLAAEWGIQPQRSGGRGKSVWFRLRKRHL